MATALSEVEVMDCPVDKDIMFLVKTEIGGDWKALAESLLPSSEVDVIKHDNFIHGLKEMAYQSLRIWTQSSPKEATARNLVSHLEKIGQKKLAYQVREMAITKSGHFKSGQSLADVYLAVMNTYKNNWKPIALQFLSQEEVAQIEKTSWQNSRSDMMYQCLVLWETKQNQPPTVQNVIDCLAAKGDNEAVQEVVTTIFDSPSVPSSVSEISKQYNMNYATRGIVLIFNQKNFQNQPNKTRHGTEEDRDALEKTFIKLGFIKNDIIKKDDFTKQQIEDELTRVSKKVDHTNNACLVVVMLSHGGLGYVETHDCHMPTGKLWEPFHGANCSSLAGKPKIFFVQACRGNRRNPSIQLDADEEEMIDATPIIESLPQYFTDLLIAYATPPGFVSVRNSKSGSWFIQTLCEALTNFGHNKDVVSILTDINNEVAQKACSYGQQAPGYTSFLRKKVVFPQRRFT